MAQHIWLRIVSSNDGKVKTSQINFADIYNVICNEQEYKLAQIDPYKDTFLGFHDTCDLVREIEILEKKYPEIKELFLDTKSFFKEVTPGDILCFIGD